MRTIVSDGIVKMRKYPSFDKHSDVHDFNSYEWISLIKKFKTPSNIDIKIISSQLSSDLWYEFKHPTGFFTQFPKTISLISKYLELLEFQNWCTILLILHIIDWWYQMIGIHTKRTSQSHNCHMPTWRSPTVRLMKYLLVCLRK